MIAQLKLSSNQIIIIAVIFVLVRGFAFYHAITQPETVYTRDSIEYKQAAVNLLERHISYAGDLNEDINPSLYSRRPPGYPLFLIFAKLLSSLIWYVIFLQSLMNILSIIFLFKILMMLEFQNIISFSVLLTFVVYPTQIILHPIDNGRDSPANPPAGWVILSN